MDRNSPINILVETFLSDNGSQKVSPKFIEIIARFVTSYTEAINTHSAVSEQYIRHLETYLRLIKKNLYHPYQFEPMHTAIRAPFDYHSFGLEIIRPLIDFSRSTLRDKSVLVAIEKQLERKENVFLLANHQSEADPQALGLLLEKEFNHLKEMMFFIAGDRVTTDPMAIPMSMGCNLLCIYSKRYIENPPERKNEKLHHNQKTMRKLQALLNNGGALIYIAPSGGRDRKNENGVVEIAPFDPQSVELFYLLGKKARCPTHFYPLALDTYSVLPPPPTVQKELGELRTLSWSPIHAHFSPEIDMENFPGCAISEKAERRKKRAEFIWNIVNETHKRFP